MRRGYDAFNDADLLDDIVEQSMLLFLDLFDGVHFALDLVHIRVDVAYLWEGQSWVNFVMAVFARMMIVARVWGTRTTTFRAFALATAFASNFTLARTFAFAWTFAFARTFALARTFAFFWASAFFSSLSTIALRTSLHLFQSWICSNRRISSDSPSVVIILSWPHVELAWSLCLRKSLMQLGCLNCCYCQ